MIEIEVNIFEISKSLSHHINYLTITTYLVST